MVPVMPQVEFFCSSKKNARAMLNDLERSRVVQDSLLTVVNDFSVEALRILYGGRCSSQDFQAHVSVSRVSLAPYLLLQ
jgi:hypothetical protein